MYMFRNFALTTLLIGAMLLSTTAQEPDSKNKNLDVRSSLGDLHVGADADARKVGLPLYPGARWQSHDSSSSSDSANLSVLTEAFGMKVVVANYVSADDPSKIVEFYRGKLRKYGKVLECHSAKHGGDVSVHDDKNDAGNNNELKCDNDNSGPVTELKVGTEDNQRVVAVEQDEGHKGSKFALVYVRTRGKMGDI
jgi:hypothetical protein